MKPDPIELEVFRHLLVSIAEEMGAVLRKTSYSANIKERRDYSCAVYDAAGETVAMGDHMPVHLGAMPLSVRHAMQAFDFAPGDVAILNDPFRGGTHLPDITAVSGVFVKGNRKPVFYVANRAHHADVGGMSPGSMPLAREIYQEGIRIPPILLVRGRPLRSRVAGPDSGQRADARGARRRSARTVHGHPARRTAAARAGCEVWNDESPPQHDALKDYSERMMRAAIRRLPRGEYRFEDSLDSDGITDRPVKIAVTVTIHGDRATIDFTGSEPASGRLGERELRGRDFGDHVRVSLSGPRRHSLYRGRDAAARSDRASGSVVNAQPPAAMAAGNVETSQRITDVVLGALAQAAPQLIPAASSGTMNNVTFGGKDPVRGRAFAYYETIAGGMGASAVADGLSATHTHMTNSWNTPVEAFEHQYPLRIRGYRIRSGSGGAGRHRGGDGIIREFEFLTPADVTMLADRRLRGPYGLSGGESGAPGRTTLLKGKRAIAIPGKARFEVEAGDVLRIESPGGGGYGQPD